MEFQHTKVKENERMCSKITFFAIHYYLLLSKILNANLVKSEE